MIEWQPISTAPKDKPILVCNEIIPGEYSYDVVYYVDWGDNGGIGGWYNGDVCESLNAWSHWSNLNPPDYK